MDIIFTLKSIYNVSKYSYNIFQLFEEPINLIENIYIGNLYHISNWVILRDYNFKFIIGLYKKKPEFDFIDIKFNNFELNFNLIKENHNEIKSKLELIINNIIKSQSFFDSKNEYTQNIIISYESKNNLILLLVLLLKTKYNLSLNRILKLLEIKKIIANNNIDSEILEICNLF